MRHANATDVLTWTKRSVHTEEEKRTYRWKHHVNCSEYLEINMEI